MSRLEQKIAFDKLVRNATLLGMPFDSSAQKFDAQIRAIVPPPVQLYHDYKFPGNRTARDFEYMVQKWVYVLLFDYRREITDTKNYYADLVKKSMDRAAKLGASSQFLDEVANHYFHLSERAEQALAPFDAPKRLDLANAIQAEEGYARTQAIQAVTELKQLNPKLEQVRVDFTKDVNILDFLQGVNYGFAPEDIDYFLNTPMDVRNQDSRIFEKIGIQPEYLVRPDRAEKIVNAIIMARAQQYNNTRG